MNWHTCNMFHCRCLQKQASCFGAAALVTSHFSIKPSAWQCRILQPLLCAATYLWNHRHWSCSLILLILLQLRTFLVPPIAMRSSGQESCCWSTLPHLCWILSVLGVSVQFTNASLRLDCLSIVCTFAEHSLQSATFSCSGSLPASNVPSA